MKTIAASRAPRIPRSQSRCPLEEHLDLVTRRLDALVRSQGLDWDEADEFRSWCMVKLLENDGHILRSFRGQSSLKTYLTTVLRRLLLDFRDHRWGRFRPCAAARRVGRDGIELERLLVMDGRSLDEALGWMFAHRHPTTDEDTLRQLAAELPIRARQLRPQGLETAQRQAAPDHADDTVLEREEEARRRQILTALQHALAQLPEQDRKLLRLRFQEGATMPEVACELGEDAKPLYRRVYRLLDSLRASLRSRGVQAQEVAVLFG